MDSLESFAGTAILVGLVFLVIWARRREPAVTKPRVEAAAPSVLDFLHSGRKIEAIKLYRRQHGVGLKEAKDAVEALAQGLPR